MAPLLAVLAVAIIGIVVAVIARLGAQADREITETVRALDDLTAHVRPALVRVRTDTEAARARLRRLATGD